MPANIGSLYFLLRGDGKQLEVDSKKAGEAAGAAAGLAASQTLGSSFKKGLPGALSSFGTGILQGMGQEAWRGISGAINDVVSAIPDLIERGKQYGLLVDDIADVTGASAESASRLAGTLAALGIPTAGLAANFRILSTQIVTNEERFREYGIATRDVNGVHLDTVTVLENVRRNLAGMTDGADKADRATKLLGRSALDLIDYLNLSDEQAAALEGQLRSLGLVVGEEFRAEAEKAKREASLLDLAFTGLGVTLQAEVGPIVRRVIGGITQFIIDNMATIREAIATVASAFAGLLGGLIGADFSGITTFVDDLGNLGTMSADGMGQLNSELATLNEQRDEIVAAEPKVTGGTNASTAAIDRQTAAIEKQVAAIEKREAAAEKAYQREIARVAAAIQGQLDLLDAEERRLAMARRDADLAADLLAAQEELRAAQTAGPGGTVDRAAEIEAQQRIAAAQAAIRENERTKEVDARRARLEETKTYIENLAQLEANAENRKALATTLANRRKALEDKLAVAQAAGDADEVARLTTKLEAVKTTEARNQTALREQTRKSELEKTKAELAETKKAITAAFAGGSDEARKKWKENVDKIDASIAETRANIQSLYQKNVMARTLMGAGGGGEAPLGTGGGLATALEETAAAWQRTGEDLRRVILGDGTPGSGIVGAIQAIGKAIDDLMHLELPDWLQQILNMGDLGGARRPVFAPKPGGGYEIIVPEGEPGRGKGGTYAAGGTIPAGGWGFVGEAGLERAYSLPGGGTYIQPLASSTGGLAPAVIRLEIGGRPLVDYIDEQLAYRPRR